MEHPLRSTSLGKGGGRWREGGEAGGAADDRVGVRAGGVGGGDAGAEQEVIEFRIGDLRIPSGLNPYANPLQQRGRTRPHSTSPRANL